MNTLPLQRPVNILFLFFLVFAGLYFAKPFLVPFTFAVILSMLLYPVCKWFESKKISRGFASLFSLAGFVLIIAGVIALLVWQITKMASDIQGIEQKLAEMTDKVQRSLENSFGLTVEKQDQFIQKQKQSGGGRITNFIKTFLSGLSGLLIDMVLTFAYVFLLLFFRKHLKQFILKIVPHSQQNITETIINDSAKMALKYFTGLAIMISVLWVMYGIGFSIIGIKNPIFFAILCGLLEMVPFAGNLLGTAITIIGALAQGGSSNMIIGVLITYALVQFIQTYLLQPLIVGSEQNINPLFTIVILVIGQLVWGIPGMILALPILGIIKVICDNLEPLKPYGYLIGQEEKKKTPGKKTP